jgi:hypothetical protein
VDLVAAAAFAQHAQLAWISTPNCDVPFFRPFSLPSLTVFSTNDPLVRDITSRMPDVIWAALAGAVGGIMRRRNPVGALPGALLGLAACAPVAVPGALLASGLALTAGWMARAVSDRRIDVPIDGRLAAAVAMGFLLRGAFTEIAEIRRMLWTG